MHESDLHFLNVGQLRSGDRRAFFPYAGVVAGGGCHRKYPLKYHFVG